MFKGFNPSDDALQGISVPLTYRIGSVERPRRDSRLENPVMERVETLHYKDDYRRDGYLPRYLHFH